MRIPNHRPVVTVLIIFALFLGVSRPVEAAGFGGVHPLTWMGSVVQSIEGFFGHLFAPKDEPAAAPSPTPTPTQESVQRAGEQAPAPVTNITQLISPFGGGLTLISQYGDIYPKDGLAPALGTTTHPYSQLNLTKATIDSSGNLTLAGGLTVQGVAGGIAHIDGLGKLWTGKLDTSDIGSGTLGVGNGGTGATTLMQYGVLYGNGTSGITALTPGTNGYVLQSNGTTAAPTWVAASGISAGNAPFAGITSGVNTVASMLVGSGASLDYAGTGIINASSLLGNTWATPGTIGSTTPNTATFSSLTVNGNVSLGNGNTYQINGMSVINATTLGSGILTSSLTGVGTITTGVWNGALIGTQYGGTGATSFTANGVIYGNGAGALQALAPGTAGLLLQSNGGGNAPGWVAASGLTAGNVAYSGVTSATNTTAAMLVGSGASLGFSGSGTINASSLLGTTWAAPGAIGSTTPNTGAFTTLTTSGNVGIGTTNIAGAGLTVGGNQLLINANGASSARIGDYSSTAGIWLRFSDGNSYYDSAANTNFRTNGGTAVPLQLFAGGNAEVTNNLGIGNGTPLERLDVSGNATVSGNLTLSGGARTIAARAGNTLTIGDSQTGNVVLNQGGNVGIGTTTPAGKFEVDGSVVFKGPDPWLDVKAYGAKGDGVTDDTTAIQNALNQWSGTSGPGVIYFPKGTYKITSTLTFPLTQGKTMQGAGSYMSTIQQATDNIPIVSIANENTHTIRIVDMGFAFKNQQTASNTNGYGFQFLSTTGGVSGMYHWVVERSRFANAYIGIGVTGSAGQVGIIWGSVFQTLYFDHTQHTAIRLVSPQTFGMNDNEFDNIKIINTGGAAITSDGPALEFSAVGARINNLDIEGWYNQILQNTGGFAVSITQMHIEHHIFTNSYAIMIYNANGSLQIKQAEIAATNQVATNTRLFVNTVSGELDLQDFTVSDTLSSGTVSFLQASAGAPVYLRNIKDSLATTSIPALASDTITLAQVKQYDNNFYNGVLFGIAADTNLYRSATSTLKTDGTLQVGAGFQQLGAGNSFFTGNVGIGTTNPVNKLGIAGGVAIGSYAGVSTAPTNGLIVSGNVGVGTTTPQNPLDVSGAIAVGTYAGANAAPVGTSFIASGNVGIGTTNPLTNLDVRGAASVGGLGTATAPLNTSTNASGLEVNLGFNSLVTLGDKGTGLGGPALTLYRTTSGTRSGTAARILNNSSAFDFRIQQGTTNAAYGAETYTDRFVINANGNIGIGTTGPANLLDVYQSANAGVTGVVTNDNAGTAASAGLAVGNTATINDQLRVLAMGTGFTTSGGFVQDSGVISAETNLSNGLSLIARASSAPIRFYTGGFASERMRIDGVGNVGIGTTNPTLGPLQMASGAYVTSGGVWTNASDRNLKTNFTSLDAQAILSKIDTLSVSQWNYKSEDAAIRHIGPVAQDFYSIFGVGNTNTSISTIDPAGIALLGIQALDQKYTQLSQQAIVGPAQPASPAVSTQSVASLQTSLQSLADRVATLEKQHPSQPSLFSASLSASLQGVSLSSAKDATIAGTLAVQGRTLLNDLGVTGDITTGVIAIHGLDGTIDAIGNTLKLQSLGTGSIDLLAGKVTVDASGNVVAKGEVTAKKINIDESDPASASSGKGILKAGSTAVTIKTTAVGARSHLFVTPRVKTNRVLGVTSESDGVSFTVEAVDAPATDIPFDWWIVN